MSEIIMPQNRWFKPFEGYDQMQYQFNRKDFASKRLPRTIEGLGLVNFDASWDFGNPHESEQNVFFFNGFQVESIEINRLYREQEDAEVRVAYVDPNFDFYLAEHLIGTKWEVNFRFPDSTILRNITSPKEDKPGFRWNESGWQRLSDEEICTDFVTYETGFILGQIECNIKML